MVNNSNNGNSKKIFKMIVMIIVIVMNNGNNNSQTGACCPSEFGGTELRWQSMQGNRKICAQTYDNNDNSNNNGHNNNNDNDDDGNNMIKQYGSHVDRLLLPFSLKIHHQWIPSCNFYHSDFIQHCICFVL